MKQTPLKTKKTLKARVKPTRRKKTKFQKLWKEADKLHAKAVRLRDSQLVDGSWQGKCITCERICLVIDANGKWQRSNGWGHFVGRGCYLLRYDSENVNLQCSHCNAWRDKLGMLEAYKVALDDKYGDGTASKLEGMASEEFRLTIPFLEEVIDSAKAEIEFYLK